MPNYSKGCLCTSSTGFEAGTVRYNEDQARLQQIWGTRGQPGFDIDHINSLNDGGFEHPPKNQNS